MSNFFDDSFSGLDMIDSVENEENTEEELEESDYVSGYEAEDANEDEDLLDKKPSYSLNKQEKSVVNEAMLRLEQARLYEMLLKHSFFEGIRINPLAKQNVEQELKKFILDRLEILLGIKQESERNMESHVTVELPFNNIEIEFLKALAYKGTNGASISDPAVQARATIQPLAKPILKPKQEGLKPLIQQPKPKQLKQIHPQKQTQPTKQAAPLPPPQPKPTKPQPKKKSRTIEEIAKEDLEKMKNRKPVHEMTVKELMAANKSIAGGGSRPRPKDALPMPTNEQQVMAIMASKPNQVNEGNNLNALISKALGAIPIETISDE